MTKQNKKPGSAMKETRREGRTLQENKVKFRITSYTKQPHVRKTYYALTRDLSVDGMRILTEKFLPIETEIQMEIELLDSNKLINLNGKVIWISSLYEDELYEVGIEFIGASTEKIIDLIEHIFER